MWEPSGCCFCFNRKTGCLILGSLSLIGAILKFLQFIHILVAVDLGEAVKEFCEEEKYQFPDCDTVLLKIVITTIVVSVVIELIQVIFSSMFIHGLRKEITCLLMPYIILELINIIILLITGVVSMGALGYLSAWGLFFFIGIVVGVIAFLKTYFLLVMRAHYIEMMQSVGEVHRRLEEAPFIEPQMPFQPIIKA